MKRTIVLLAALCAFASGLVSISTAAVKQGDKTLEWLGLNPAQVWTGLSTDTKPAPSANKAIILGAAFFETDTRRVFFYNGTAWVLRGVTYTTPADTLSKPGPAPAYAVNGYTNATFAILDSLYTNTGVTLRFEGYVNGIGWGPLDAESDTLNTTNTGVTLRTYTAVAGLDSIRWNFWAEAGGVAARLRGLIKLWNSWR